MLDAQSVFQTPSTISSCRSRPSRLKISQLEKTNSSTSPAVEAANAELGDLYGEQSTLQVDENSYAVVQQKATVPSSQSGLGKKKVTGLALLIGLLAGAGIAFVREQFDVSLKSTSGVKELTDAPVLAELPFDREFSLDNGTLAVLDLPGSALAESVRELRTSLEVILEDKPCPVVMITSSSPEDGKTFMVANLAASWAISGKRVVVVSGDLRRPRIEQALLVDSGSPGVKDLAALDRREDYQVTDQTTSALNGVIGSTADSSVGREQTAGGRGSSRWLFPQARSRPLPSQQDVVSALKPTRVVGLSLLPSGGVATNSSEVLNSPGMKAVMERLSNFADVILVDSPPSDGRVRRRHSQSSRGWSRGGGRRRTDEQSGPRTCAPASRCRTRPGARHRAQPRPGHGDLRLSGLLRPEALGGMNSAGHTAPRFLLTMGSCCLRNGRHLGPPEDRSRR